MMKRIAIKCTATNTRDFIYDEYTAIGLDIDPDIIEELDQLEAKAEELDRRENGVAVTFSHFEVFAYATKDYYTCSNCKRDDVMEDTKYCPRCGCRIDWNEVT